MIPAPETMPPAGLAPVAIECIYRPGPVHCTIFVGVGQSDETPLLAGISHLAEHVLFRRMGSESGFVDGETSASTVTFTTVGDAPGIASFLDRFSASVCSIGDLSESDLALEKQIIEAENPPRFQEFAASIATVRHGYQGFGMVDAWTPGLGSITRDAVVAWIREHFHASNVVVTVQGDLGGHVLAMSLPSSPSQRPPSPSPSPSPRAPHIAQIITTPVVSTTPLGGLTFSLIIPISLATPLVHAIEWSLFEKIRAEKGLAYGISSRGFRLDDEWVSVAFMLDPLSERVADCAVAVVDLLREVARQGFDAGAVSRIHGAARLTQLDLDARASAELDKHVEARLRGLVQTPVDDELEEGLRCDGQTLGRALEDVLDSLIVMVDDQADVSDVAERAQLPFLPFDPGPPLSGSEFRSRIRGARRWAPRGLAAFAGFGAFVRGQNLLLGGPGGGSEWNLAKSAVVYHSEQRAIVVASNGGWVQLDPTAFRRGANLIAAVVAATPPGLLRLLPESRAT